MKKPNKYAVEVPWTFVPGIPVSADEPRRLLPGVYDTKKEALERLKAWRQSHNTKTHGKVVQIYY